MKTKSYMIFNFEFRRNRALLSLKNSQLEHREKERDEISRYV